MNSSDRIDASRGHDTGVSEGSLGSGAEELTPQDRAARIASASKRVSKISAELNRRLASGPSHANARQDAPLRGLNPQPQGQ